MTLNTNTARENRYKGIRGEFIPEIEERIVYESTREEWDKNHKNQVPILRGCANENGCYCTGACQVIIGWRDKLPGEL